jgi:hypothetical protein
MNFAEPTYAISNASRFGPDPTAHVEHDRFLNNGAKFEHSFAIFDNRRQLIRKFEELNKGSPIFALIDLCESTMKVDHVTSVRCRHCKPIPLASGRLLPDWGLDGSRNGSWLLPGPFILDHTFYIT